MFECPIFLIGKITVLAFGNETTKCNVAFSLKNASAVTISVYHLLGTDIVTCRAAIAAKNQNTTT